MKNILQFVLAVFAVFGLGTARAGIPVIDAANLANSVQQVVAWGQQYTQMAQQYQQMVQQYNQAVNTFNSLNGIRGMASLVNDPALRRYMPNEWSQIMNLMNAPGAYTGLQGSINAIKAATKIVALADTNIGSNTAAGRAFVGVQNQNATNRALTEEGFLRASERIDAIQVLIQKVDGAPEQKDVLDLQARIQSEQVMVQNEMVKLNLLGQLMQVQRDIAAQQAREISMQSTKTPGGITRF